MNIFFLSMNPSELAYMYCDQHIVKIQLEICQMLYTAWHLSNESGFVENNAPYTKNGNRRGYRSAHAKHPMTLWIASSLNNYTFACEIGMAITIEYTRRYGKVHACAKHILWLYQNKPHTFTLRTSDKAYYSDVDIKEGLTPIPECLPEEYRRTSVISAYKTYYSEDKMKFARFNMR